MVRVRAWVRISIKVRIRLGIRTSFRYDCRGQDQSECEYTVYPARLF